MKLGTYKIFRILSKISLLLIGLSLVGYLGYITYQSITFAPKKVRITNITESSATISWVTDTPTKGVVYYKQENSFLPGLLGFVGAKKAYDDRDYYGAQLERVNDVNEKNLGNKDADYVVDPENIDYEDFKVTKLGDYYTHHVTIRGLDPVSKYYFVVSDNWFSWSIEGVYQGRNLEEVPLAFEFNFSTLDSLNSIPSPNPAYGKVVGVYRDENNFVHDNLNQDTIVYGFLFEEENMEKTAIYSSVTNREGGWVLDKSTMRTEEGFVPYNFKTGEDYLVLYPQYMNMEESFSVGLLLGVEDSPASDLVGGGQDESMEDPEEQINSLINKFIIPLYAQTGWADFRRAEEEQMKKDVASGSLVVMTKSDGTKAITGSPALYNRSGNTDLATKIEKKIEEQVDKGAVITNSNPSKTGLSKKILDKSDINAGELLKKSLLAEDDSRNTQVPCNEDADDNWSINCYYDEPLPTCKSDAESAGCRTNAACYHNGGRGYANKCIGCARPENCANVWSRPSDVVVDGKLYTKTDLLSVALGMTEGNELLEGLSASLAGKTICTNQAGDKIMGVVNNSNSCPQYSYPTLKDFKPGGLVLEDSDICRNLLKGLDKNMDADKYCQNSGSKEIDDSDDRSDDCGYGVISCNSKDRNDSSILCDVSAGFVRVMIDNKYFCQKSGTKLLGESEELVVMERNLYAITVIDSGGFFIKDVTIVTEYINNVLGGIASKPTDKPGLDRQREIKAWLTKEEYEKLSKCLKDIYCPIKNGTVKEVEKTSTRSRFYESGSDKALEMYDTSSGDRILVKNQNDLVTLSANLGIPENQLIPSLSGNMILEMGFIKVEDMLGNQNLKVVSVDLDRYFEYQNSLAKIARTQSFDYYVEPQTILPEKSGVYKMDLLSICPTMANDREHCTVVYGRSGTVLSELGINNTAEKFYEVKVISPSEVTIPYCVDSKDCTASYTVKYKSKNGQETITKTFKNLPYSTNGGIVKIKIGNDTYELIPDDKSVDVGSSADWTDIEKDSYFNTAVEDIKEGFQSSILNKIMKIYGPQKVWAEDSEKYISGSSDTGLYEIITSSGEKVYYVDTTDQKYIVFYEEANNEPGFQEPLDINNPKEDEDILVFVNKDSVKKISQAYQYWIEEGINMMSFPFLPVNQEKKAMMASDLMISNNTTVKKVSQVTYFENGKWAGGIKASGDNKYVGYDFPLVPGRGYLIVGEYGTNISIPGFPLSEPFPVELSAGWNFVGVHGYPDIYTAEKLIDEMDKLEGIDVDNVTWWPRNLGRYEGLQKTGDTKYGFDYPLSDRLAYFVRVTSYSNKCPRSVLWNPGGESNGICGSN